MAKIALVLDRYDPWGGGLEQWVHRMALWLTRSGHEVHAVAFDIGRVDGDAGVRLHKVEKKAGRLGRAAALETYLRGMRPDVVHDMGVGWYWDILQPQAGSKRAGDLHARRSSPLLTRIRKALSPSEGRRRRDLDTLEARQYAPGKGIIVTVSRMVQEHLRLYHGVDRRRTTLIYNGVDLQRFSQGNRPEHRKSIRTALGIGTEVIFLLAGHNYQLKGVREAMKSMQRLRAAGPPCRLVVIGRGPVERYRAMARRLKIHDHVRFCGFVDNPESYFAAADVLVHPTFYDACSLVVMEAWASGLPVVTTRFNGAAELMTDGEQGFVIDDPFNVAALTDRMRRLLDAPLRSRMGRAARSLGLAHPVEGNFERIGEIYLRVMERRAGGLAVSEGGA